MRDSDLELTRLFFLLEDWINGDRLLSEHFHLWPDVSTSGAWDQPIRWIMVKSRNCAYIKEDGVGIMDPIVALAVQTLTRWVELKPADPQFFEKLRSYLMHFV